MKNETYGTGYSHCTRGALTLESENYAELEQVEAEVLAYLRAEGMLTGGTSSIPHWNDQPERSAEDVREVLLMTAKKLRNGE